MKRIASMCMVVVVLSFLCFASAGADIDLRKGCCTWELVPTSNAQSYFLTEVAAVSLHDVWAVCAIGNSMGGQTLIEHWDGAQWSIVPSPNGNRGGSQLNGVTRVPGTHWLWTVGFDDWQTETLTESYCRRTSKHSACYPETT